MANANTALVRQLIEAMGAGDPQAYFDRLADDVRYTVIGSTPFSGTCKGRDQLVERVVMPLMEKLDGFVKVTPHTIFGEGDLVCVQANGEARTKSGHAYNNTYCFVFRLRADKIVEVTEYMDTDLVRSVLC